MVQYYACKSGSDWKLAKGGTPDEAYLFAFRSRLNNYSSEELVVAVGTRKPEAQNRLTNLEKGTNFVAFCGCGLPYLADPTHYGFRSCDCGRTLMANGQPL